LSGQHGIQVNGVGPGYFKTELTEALVKDETFSNWLIGRTPSRRWGDVEDLVGAAVFLASNASNFVNGHILYVDGGVTATLRVPGGFGSAAACCSKRVNLAFKADNRQQAAAFNELRAHSPSARSHGGTPPNASARKSTIARILALRCRRLGYNASTSMSGKRYAGNI
jgi:Enoyl-(Acyl carrier protein) reductase